MTRRRLMVGLAIVIALLFAGRWTAEFLAERWWAGTISSGARTAVTRWMVAGVVLDLAAIFVASVWFAVQAILVARSVDSVQITERVGDMQLRRRVPNALLLLVALGTGVLLGIVTGSGARAWRAPVLLSMYGARFGTTDPLLGEDLGTYAAQLPAWQLAFEYAVLLTLVGIVFTAVLYGAIGAIRRDGRALDVHPDARRHLGALLAVLAAVLAAGYCLVPFHIASAEIVDTVHGAARARVVAGQVMAGIAASVAVLTTVWVLRPRRALLVGAWAMFLVCGTIERFMLPSGESESRDPALVSLRQRYTALAYGIHLDSAAARGTTHEPFLGVWDPNALSAVARARGTQLIAAAPTGLAAAPRWLLVTATDAEPGRIDVLTVDDRASDATAIPEVTTAGVAREAGEQLPLVYAGAPQWRATAAGVSVGVMARRVAVAWALQAAGVVSRSPDVVDWHLDPTERAAAIMPMVEWLGATPILIRARLFWVVRSLVTADRLPLTTRVAFGDGEIAGASLAFVAVIDAADGTTRIFLDPAAGPVARAWGEFASAAVDPPSELPPEVTAALAYPSAWLMLQTAAMAPAWFDRSPLVVANAGGSQPVTVWLDSALAATRVALRLETAAAPSLTITGYVRGGSPHIRIDTRDSMYAAVSPQRRSPNYLRLRDSARAAGDSIANGPQRWDFSGPVPVAWQPTFLLPRTGLPRLLWLAMISGERYGGERAPQDAWRTVTDSAPVVPSGPTDMLRLENARTWLRQADSALARRDMTAFGRAYEALRDALGPPRPE